ncbi:tetratricopeptide repeat protein [Cerasicoccus arenae]|uniref:tetratricopeptide repeat protein n=1 Tax=Cerasicoccus arenae TaxID=424488 RepID=UPI0016770BC4|nr:tetratricopeptide repeat protein [Cerasicoccus arenae]MBK1858580.1 tetratricopeptide repeat protein [Cerasicoccus arenae]
MLIAIPSAANAQKSPIIDFDQANALYAEGKFEEAATAYQKLLPEHQSASVHYNLGNAYYHLGEYGPAILHFEKALALDPRNPDIRANLELTQEAAQLTPPPPLWAEIVADFAPVNTWTWLAVVSFWVAAALLLLAPLYRWKGPLRGGLTALSILILIASGIGLYGWHVRGSYGVVLTDEATLSVAPTASSPGAGSVKAGELARIRKQHGDYYLVTVGDNKFGWLPNTVFSPVWD